MRKNVISIVTAAALTLIPSVAVAVEADTTTASIGSCGNVGDLTLLATTDTHGTVLNYDYFTGQSFGTAKNEARGLELLSTAIQEIRTSVGEDSVLLLDNGDANQGNPLETVYHANRTVDSVDPMAAALNYIGYDAGVVGNHEWNYGYVPGADGIRGDLLQYQDNLDYPLLGANAVVKATGKPLLDPYTIISKTVNGQEVKIGVIGVVTPGVRIWDGSKVTQLEFQDQVQAVQQYVPEVKAAGADVVVVLAHTGEDPKNYQWNPADLQENALRSIAENTADVDVIIGGHSHVEDNYNTKYTNAQGKAVLVSQPGYHGRFLSQLTVPLSIVDGKVMPMNTAECAPSAKPVYASQFIGQEDPEVLAAIKPWHEKTLQWVATVVAQAGQEMSAAESAWKDTPILDFINKVQVEAVAAGLNGSEYEGLPIVSQASPFSRTAVFQKGDVTIADMAALYVYDNTLYGSLITGAQLKDYLEWSARYYQQQEVGAKIEDWSTVTNAMYEGETRGIPDYSYDVLSGVNYHINISQPVGKRIENLTYPDGNPVQADDKFILAVNNYRQGGGSGYPHIANAPIVYDQQEAIRDLLIQWAQNNGTIDPADFFVENWTVSTTAADKSSRSDNAGVLNENSVTDGVNGVANHGNHATTVKQTSVHVDNANSLKHVNGQIASSGAKIAAVAIFALVLLAGGIALLIFRRREKFDADDSADVNSADSADATNLES